jgi:hypothetical protein
MRCQSLFQAVMVITALGLTPESTQAQKAPDIGFRSVGRAAPLRDDVNQRERVGATLQRDGTFNGSARGGHAPPGIKPLPRDLFTSPDFYADRALWSDPRYFRCNSPLAIEGLWGTNAVPSAMVNNSPASAPWGHCDRDYPRESIVSPYPFYTAQQHYEALLKETRDKGALRQHTPATLPNEWNGIYRQPRFVPGNDYWFVMRHVQASTVLSLLTEEYRQRAVQELYHHGHTNKPMWPSQYCWPEGFLRRWHEWAAYDRQFLVTPQLVQIYTSGAMNFITQIHTAREFRMDGPVPRLGENVPRWYGETIGFWHDDTLITWTSNIQAWTTHSAFEHSDKMQSIEIYTPLRDAKGAFLGLNHEAILYDPEALVEPVRILVGLVKIGEFDDPKLNPIVFTECVQTIYPIKGTATPLTPGREIQFEVPDMYGRPWARLWEKYWEPGMQRPEQEDLFDFTQPDPKTQK